MPRLRHLFIGLIALGTVAETTRMLAETATGPSSSASPYVINVPANVDITAILTVGDSVSDKPDGITPYRMVGIPDGLGAYDNNDGTFTVLMNHELGATNGIERAHGFLGAFVSQWIIRKSDLKVLHGGDLIKKLMKWDGAKFVPATDPATDTIGRLCSANLPLPSGLNNRQSGKGYSGRIFMDGEEVGSEGRAFAHIVSGPGAGTSYQLPSLGRFSWENAVASPYEQDKTVVIGMDDSTPGQVYVYIGEKQGTGSEIEKAGLHGGSLYGLQVLGFPMEDITTPPVPDNRGDGIASGARFLLHNFGDVREMTGAQIQAEGEKNLVTDFLRPEDGAWDTRNPNVFYFITTDRYDMMKDGTGTVEGRSRLHRLTFDDIEDPEKGGTYDVLLDGTGPYQMLDNMTVDVDGNLILQEDPGAQHHLARIWKFFPRNGALIEIAKHDPARFGNRNGTTTTPPTAPFNIDEESSGVIEITRLLRKKPQGSEWDGVESDGDEFDEQLKWAKRGYRYYLADTQAHYSPNDAELVEGGQLYLIGVPKGVR